jgi:lambda repressor-like predicted transcriptional regulator
MARPQRNASREYLSLRARLLRRGITLRGFARQNGYRPSTVFNAARGERSGHVTTRIREQLEIASNE